MTVSRTGSSDPVMGRADVLLRFLQLIGKDHPQDVDALLTDLDRRADSRPIVDQIVDRIISGDPNLYELYARALREAGSRNPYASRTESSTTEEYAGAFGQFITNWIALEAELRSTRYRPAISASTKSPFISLRALIQSSGLPSPLIQELLLLNDIRNRTVHGMVKLPPEELREAANSIIRIREELEPGKPSSSGGASTKKRTKRKKE
jgi:hypothetical protein